MNTQPQVEGEKKQVEYLKECLDTSFEAQCHVVSVFVFTNKYYTVKRC